VVPLLPPQVGSVSFDRQGIADHATQLAKNVQGNLQRSLEALKVVRLLRSLIFRTVRRGAGD